jgi:hypothetical protein
MTLMRIMLRNWETGLYYSGPGRWVASPEAAHVFVSIQELTGTRHCEGLKEMEAVFHYASPKCELRVPLERE